MKHTIEELTEQLICIQTDPDRIEDLGRALQLVVGELEAASPDITVEHFQCNGYPSILAYYGKQRPSEFSLLLNGHLDVIPGAPSQYLPTRSGDKLCGVGSMDMKGSVAAMVSAFCKLRNHESLSIGLQIVTEEEVGGFWGTRYQIEQGVRTRFVIAGESTGFNIVNQAKGVLWLKVSCTGVAAHGAYPWNGENALWKMHEFLGAVAKEFPNPESQAWKSTLNLARIETGNHSFNKVPSDCCAWFDMRFIPEDKVDLLDRFKAIVPSNFTLEVVAHESELNVPEDNSFLQTLRQVTTQVLRREPTFYGAQGSSDARHFTKVGMPGIEFGPLGGGIGTADEWVSIQSLYDFESIIVRYVEELKKS